MNSTELTPPPPTSFPWTSPGTGAGGVSETDTRAFTLARPRLLGIARQMLRSEAEADDVVQDAWIRWQTTDRRKVETPTAFLATTTTRLAVNVIQSARVRHDAGAGNPDLEPADPRGAVTDGAELAEDLEASVRILLERLSPPERAAYVLHEAFDYPYRDIGRVLSTTDVNARQLASRARRHLADGPTRPVATGDARRFFDVFAAAAQTGELAALEELLAADVLRPEASRRSESRAA